MFLGEKVRYFVKDELDKEWIVDMFDPGKRFSAVTPMSRSKRKKHG